MSCSQSSDSRKASITSYTVNISTAFRAFRVDTRQPSRASAGYALSIQHTVPISRWGFQ